MWKAQSVGAFSNIVKITRNVVDSFNSSRRYALHSAETDGAGAGREPSVRLVTVGRRTPRPQHRHTYISDLVDTLSYKPHGDLDLISVGQYFDI